MNPMHGVKCVCVCVFVGNCVDINWLDRNKYTPSGPDELQVSVDTRADEAGCLQPVLVAKWKLRDDGELHCDVIKRVFTWHNLN